ncbi:hypothetical protein PAMP_022979 [Pampus punctatissimus]
MTLWEDTEIIPYYPNVDDTSNISQILKLLPASSWRWSPSACKDSDLSDRQLPNGGKSYTTLDSNQLNVGKARWADRCGQATDFSVCTSMNQGKAAEHHCHIHLL